MVLIVFAIAFVIAPTLFLVLVQFDGRRWQIALVASVLVVLSFAFRNEARLALDSQAVPLFIITLMIWLAWVVVLVLATRSMHLAYPSPKARRWSRAIGAMGTTVPWFGFAAAQMMVK